MRSRVLLFLALAACGGDTTSIAPVTPVPDDGKGYWPAETWRTARPAAVGLDETKIASLVSRLRSNAIANFHSLVIARYGYVVVDAYFNGSTANTLHTMQSVTKSVTSLLVGIAIDRGAITGVGARYESFFPEYAALFAGDARKQRITLDDVLTMRSGIDFYEQPYAGSPLETLNNSTGDWVRLVLERPMNDVPGGHWQYNSGAVITLGAVLRAATGQTADAFAREQLFTPIHVPAASWYTGQPNGLPHMGGGLGIRAKDLARVGYLVLRDGRWDDIQVVSGAWLHASTRRHVSPGWTFAGRPTAYGYLWWGLPLDPSRGFVSDEPEIITASGAHGQWLFIVPSRDLVVAITAATEESSAVDVLYRDILGAIR